MTAPHIAFLILVGAAPLLAFADTLLVLGFVSLYVALLLTTAAISIRAGSAGHILRLVRVPAMLAVLPLLWFVVQLMPLSVGGLPKSIWESAAEGLNQPLFAHITIDPALTLLGLCRTIVVLAVLLLAMALTIDRRHAQTLFVLLGAIAAAAAVLLIVDDVGRFALLNNVGDDSVRAVFVTAAAYGVVLWTAISVMLIEKQDMRRGFRELIARLLPQLGGSLALALLCFIAMVIDRSRYAIFAALCGVFAVGMLYFVRRIGLGFRAGVALGLVGVVGAAIILWAKASPIPDAGIALRYAAHVTPEVAAPANRIATEVGPAGSGAGTFGAIYRVYGTSGASGHPVSPATFTSQVAVEMGRYALWTFVGRRLPSSSALETLSP